MDKKSLSQTHQGSQSSFAKPVAIETTLNRIKMELPPHEQVAAYHRHLIFLIRELSLLREVSWKR